MSTNKTFRLFISSTFNDLKTERNVLQNEVFPEIKEYCGSKGYRFQPIDLRWGVNDEAGLDHKAMKICIDEVKRSLNHPKPNLLILMGERYGWVPLPATIEERIFNALAGKIVDQEDLALVRKWYRLDTNSVPPEYVLQPIDELIEETELDVLSQKWGSVETRLLKILQQAAVKCEGVDTDLFFTSAMEQEIRNGVLEVDDPNRVLVLDRKITNIESENIQGIAGFETFVESLDGKNRERLEKLKERLRSQERTRYRTFETELLVVRHDGEVHLKLKKDFLDAYVRETKRFLKENIDREIARIEKLDIREVEQNQHERFMFERSRSFIGREESVERVKAYIGNGRRAPLVLHGESGVGKSALMASIVSILESESHHKVLIYRFIGVTEKSSVPILFLNDLIEEMERRLDRPHRRDYSHNDYDQVVTRFLELLEAFSEEQGVVIVIDALDQFTQMNKLEWLEVPLPENVKIVLSTLPGSYLDILVSKTEPEDRIEVKQLGRQDGKAMLETWLEENSRRLQPRQSEALLSRFSRNGLPLYLKIAFEESLHWHSYTPDVDLSATLEGIIHDYIERLIEREYHSKALVEHVLGYISASKSGLSEDELYEILSQDEVVMHAISNPHHRIQVVDRQSKLPAVIWARFYADLVRHLSFTIKDDVKLLNFYHRKISETVRDHYYAPNRYLYHAKLAEYFLTRPSVHGEGEKKHYDLRKNSELPYQLLESEAFRLFVEYYDLEVLQIKSERNHIGEALLELHDAYRALKRSPLAKSVKERLQESLVRRLLEFLLLKVQRTDSPRLSVEMIHATYVYRDERSFYDHLLELGRSCRSLRKISSEAEGRESLDDTVMLRYFIAFKARYSNKLRRQARLSKAFRSYRGLLGIIGEHTLEEKEDFNELSKIHYDMAYIRYLQGRFDEAIGYMELSIGDCERSGNAVNLEISRCVKYRMGFLSGRYTPEAFKAVLEKALGLFRAERLRNSNAKRWVRNALAHLFEVAYVQKDVDEAKRLFRLLENDDWKLEFRNENKFTSDLADRGRIAILEARYDDGVRAFEQFLYSYIGGLEECRRRESVARDYYDYLIALRGAGESRFEEVRRECLDEIPDEPGNHIWKRRIEAL